MIVPGGLLPCTVSYTNDPAKWGDRSTTFYWACCAGCD